MKATSSRPGGSTVRWARPVGRYFLRWVVGPVGTVIAAAFLIFSALTLTPGDPVNQVLDGRATDEQREAMRETLGLDQPLLIRFGSWVLGLLRGDFGTSYTYRQDVVNVLLPRAEVTIALVVYAMLLILVAGLTLGIVGGTMRRARPVVSLIVGLAISIPGFVSASFLTSMLALGLGWFPTYGAGDPGFDRIWHLTLPAIALSIGWSAYLAQISMTAIGEESGKEHVLTALGRGVPFRVILLKHILRNAGLPVITVLGLTLAALVAGSIIVESAFGVDGMGSFLIASVFTKDVPVVQAIALIIVLVFVVMTTIVDILHVALDPTLRASRRSE